MDWTTFFTNVPIYAAGLSVIIGAFVYIYKRLIKPMFRALLDYDKLSEKIGVIFEELTPNGGTSIKDQIARIDIEMALSRERHRAISADSVEAQFETDLEGDCVWINRTYTNLAQRTPSELYGHGWVNAIFEEDREEVIEEWYKSVKENREFSKSFRFCTPSGDITKVKCTSYKMTNSRDDVIGYYGKIKRVE